METSKELFNYRLKILIDAIDAEQLLRLLGFNVTKVTSKDVRATCKIHGGDNKTAFRMSKDNKTWKCFSHHCEEEVGFSVFKLIQRLMGLTFMEAVAYLENITGVNIHNDKMFVEHQRQKDRQEAIRQIDNRYVPPVLVSEEHLRFFRKHRSDYFCIPKNGGFSVELLNEFEVGGGWIDKFGFQRDVIPIRDKEGKLVAYSCRDITDKADYNYKYLLTEDFDKDKVLYNLYKVKNSLGPSKTIIVVEGFKSIWRLHSIGYKNAVACMGNYITPGQQNLLYSYAARVVILFDGDKAGVKGTLDALKNMAGKIKLIPLFLPYSGKDPADLKEKELRDILKNL